MLTLIRGDLFDVEGLDGMAHGVNAEGKMCSGIAVQFRDKFPDMHEEYLVTCETAPMAGGLFAYGDEDGFWIYNCFSQAVAGPHADLNYLYTSLNSMVRHAEQQGLERIGLPWIGTGVGALDREDVQEVFEEVLSPSSVEFVVVDYVQEVPLPASSNIPVALHLFPLVSLDTMEEVLHHHVLEWKINGYSSEFNKNGDLSKIQGWCSCLERVSDYTAHVREEILKAMAEDQES